MVPDLNLLWLGWVLLGLGILFMAIENQISGYLDRKKAQDALGDKTPSIPDQSVFYSNLVTGNLFFLSLVWTALFILDWVPYSFVFAIYFTYLTLRTIIFPAIKVKYGKIFVARFYSFGYVEMSPEQLKIEADGHRLRVGVTNEEINLFNKSPWAKYMNPDEWEKFVSQLRESQKTSAEA